MQSHEYYCLPIEHVVSRLETQLENGLSEEEARNRQKEHGFNELAEKTRPGFLKMLMA